MRIPFMVPALPNSLTSTQQMWSHSAVRALIGVSFFSVLSACNTMSDRDLARAQGAAIGCVAGGILGHFLGKDTASTLAGCVVGSVTGNEFGEHVAAKKADFANQEEYLRAVVSEAEHVTEQTKQFNQTIEQEIQQITIQRQIALQQLQTEKRDTTELQSLNETLANKIEEIQTQMELVKREIDIQRQVIAQEQSTSPQQLVSSAQNQLQALTREQALLQETLKKIQLLELDKV